MERQGFSEKTRFLRSWGVRTKLLLSFVLLTVISTGVFFWITYNETRRIAEDNMVEAEFKLLGIKRIPSVLNGFISTAAFEDPVKALREAALKGKIDYLADRQTNVMLGRLIEAATGYS